MSNSKSLKADKELVWKKLSTLPKPPLDKDLLYFQQAMWRGLRGVKKGELNVLAVGSGVGKSMVK